MSNIATIPQAQPVVDTRYTQDVLPILDTSKFEHMQRIAMIMARSSTLPESLRKAGDKDIETEQVIANCFRIVNQAVRWGMDPFAVCDCASIIHGRLMWEGKLVAAVIDAKLGVKLNYAFNDKPGRALGVKVFATLPGETQPRDIFGTVNDWHTGAKGPWAAEGAWPRQLRYRGAREWARAHTPAVMLGVYTNDELDNLSVRDVPDGQRALRFKDVSPTSAQLAIPDIPESKETAVAIAPADGTLADPDGFLAKLSDDIALCDSADELASIAESNEDLIARLPDAQKAKAQTMLLEAAE